MKKKDDVKLNRSILLTIIGALIIGILLFNLNPGDVIGQAYKDDSKEIFTSISDYERSINSIKEKGKISERYNPLYGIKIYRKCESGEQCNDNEFCAYDVHECVPVHTSLNRYVGSCGVLVDNGPKTIKIAFVSDDLNNDDLELFKKAVSYYLQGNSAAEHFFATNPYSLNRDKFNFYRIDHQGNLRCAFGEFLCDVELNRFGDECRFNRASDIMVAVHPYSALGAAGRVANGYWYGQANINLYDHRGKFNPFFGRTLTHELAHAIANTRDLYLGESPDAINSIMGNPITATEYDKENRQLICDRIERVTGSVRC